MKRSELHNILFFCNNLIINNLFSRVRRESIFILFNVRLRKLKYELKKLTIPYVTSNDCNPTLLLSIVVCTNLRYIETQAFPPFTFRNANFFLFK